MVGKDRVLQLVRRGRSYQEIGDELGIPAGQAYLVGTGMPADGSGSVTPEQRERPGVLRSGTQRLVNPSAVNPTSRGDVLEWMRRRALADAAMQAAARRRGSDQPGSDQPGSDQPGSDQPGSDRRGAGRRPGRSS